MSDWTDGYQGYPNLLFTFTHPKHGSYWVWHEGGLYGISNRNEKTYCCYASLGEMFRLKGL